jgi:hypothetical protein
MVRVGGGWVALDEFLVKNDPCRGKHSPIFLFLSFEYRHILFVKFRIIYMHREGIVQSPKCLN